MDILLLRCGKRALILPRNQDPAECPLMLRLWLGTPYCEDNTEIAADMPFPGICVRQVLAELLTTGYCALDANGGVRTFWGLGASSPPENKAGSTTDLPQGGEGRLQDPHR